jgi:CubicO group peptidase (beta-lactamase class C family)
MRTAYVLSVTIALSGCAAFAPRSSHPVDDVFRAAEAKSEFSGSVLVINNGKTIYRKAFGYAEKSRGTLNSTNSQFLIASLSKPITAVATLRLVEQGELNLEDRLGEIFPELAKSPVADVTVSQLLSHTSGMEEVLAKHLTRPLTPEDLKAAAIPGTPGKLQYSNSGYVTLKLILERVTGQTYEQAIHALVLRPSGMAHSGVLRDSSPPARLSLAYQTVGSASPIARAAPLEIFDGAGTIFSTTGDLALFIKALDGGKLLTPETRRLMESGPTPPVNWGYGWAKVKWGDTQLLAHRGDFNGYHAVLVRQPEERNLVVILSNLDKTNVSKLEDEVLEVLKPSSANERVGLR